MAGEGLSVFWSRRGVRPTAGIGRSAPVTTRFLDPRKRIGSGNTAAICRTLSPTRSWRAVGGPVRHDNWVNLYIDGIYWGVYNATEYPDSAFAADYLGDKNAADYDTIKVSGDRTSGRR